MPDVVNPDAADDENTVVKFSTDGGVAEETPPPVEEKPKPAPAPRVAPATGVEQLERQLQESRRYSERVAEQARHIAAQRDQAMAYAQQAQQRGISQEEAMAEQKIASVQSEMDALREVQVTALEAGDWRKATEINLKLADLGGEKNLYQRDKLIYESRRQQAQYEAQARQQQAAQRPPQQPQQRLPDDPVERAVLGRTPKTAEFIRSHKDLVRPDGTFKKSAMDAHEIAKDEGLVEDTDAYFQRLEQLVYGGKSMPAAEKKRAPSVAAPVSRSTATMNGIPGFDGENLVMTPHMKRLAMDQLPDLDPQEAFRQWGKAYVEGVRSGRMNPITD